MAVSWVATGTRDTTGSTSLAVPYPTGVAANRLVLLGRGVKPQTATTSTPSGFTTVLTLTGGVGSQGNDTGPSRVTVDYRILDGSETGSVATTQAGSPNSATGAMTLYEVSAGASWIVAAVGGADGSHGTGRTVTASSTISLQAGDVVVAVCASDTDTTTAFTGFTITASGITFGTTNQRLGAGGGSTGQDVGHYVYEAAVSSGSATVAPVLTLTGGPSNCGPTVFVRLRQGATTIAVPQVTESEIAQFPTAIKVIQVTQVVDAETAQLVDVTTAAQNVDVDWRAGDETRFEKKLFTVDGTQASQVTVVDSIRQLDVESTAGQLAGSNLREALVFTETDGWADGIITTTFGTRSFFGGTPDGDVIPQHGIGYRYQETASKRKFIAIWQNIVFGVNWSMLVGVWESNLDGTGFVNRQRGKVMTPLFRDEVITASARANDEVTLTVASSSDFPVGDPIGVDVATSSFDGKFFVKATTPTTITYDQTGVDESGGAGTALHVFPFAIESRVHGSVIDVRAYPPENPGLKPDWVNIDYSAGITFPGTSGNYISTPDAVALDITGDITLMVDFTPTAYPPSANQTLIAKWNTAGNQRSFRLRINATNGRPAVTYSSDGSNTRTFTADATPTLIGGRIAIKVRVDVNDGAGGAAATFFTAPTAVPWDSAQWDQLGTTQTASTTIQSIFASNAVCELGSQVNGTVELFNGKIHAATVRAGLEASWVAPVVDVEGTIIQNAVTSFTDRTEARTWTVNGTAAVVNDGIGADSTLAFSTDIDRVGREDQRQDFPSPVGTGRLALISAHLGTSDYSHVTYGPLFARNSVANFTTSVLDSILESEASQSITVVKQYTLGTAVETDTAQALETGQVATVSQVNETNAAQALTVVKFVTLGLVSETDVAQTLGLGVVAVSRVDELDVAQMIVPSHVSSTGQATEVDTPGQLSTTKTSELGASNEVDTAQSFARSKILGVTQASDVEDAQSLGVTRSLDLSGATETDVAQSLIAGQVTVAQVIETDVAQGFTSTKSATPGQVDETDVASTLDSTKTSALVIVGETDESRNVVPTKVGSLGQVGEVDTTGSLTGTKDRTLGVTVDVETAQTFTATKTLALVGATEVEVAQSFGRGLSLAVVAEVDTAAAWTSAKTRDLAQTTEVDVAVPLVGDQVESVVRVDELDFVGALGARKNLALVQVTEVSDAQLFVRSKLLDVGSLLESDVAQDIGSTHIVGIGASSEVDVTSSFTPSRGHVLGSATEDDQAHALVTAISGLSVIGHITVGSAGRWRIGGLRRGWRVGRVRRTR